MSGSKIPSLICDNPYIEREISDNVKEITEFFFPLSNNRMAYYLKDSSRCRIR